MNGQQRELAHCVKAFAGRKGNLIPEGWSERSWRQYVYAEARSAGLGINECCASLHGLRHARFHDLYEETTGFTPPVKHASSADFVANAIAVAGADWKELDAHASAQVCYHAGHGDRSVSRFYIGSWRK